MFVSVERAPFRAAPESPLACRPSIKRLLDHSSRFAFARLSGPARSWIAHAHLRATGQPFLAFPIPNRPSASTTWPRWSGDDRGRVEPCTPRDFVRKARLPPFVFRRANTHPAMRRLSSFSAQNAHRLEVGEPSEAAQSPTPALLGHHRSGQAHIELRLPQAVGP